VFGSRATGRSTRASDLDLGIDVGRPITLAERADLEEAFSQSRLPMKVDLVDMATAASTFTQRIYQTGKRLGA
jgi:predicted nucleotidyltransferase